MIHLVRSEWVKFRSVRSTLITLVVAGALVVLFAFLSINSIEGDATTTCEPVGTPTTATTVPAGTAVEADPCGPGFESTTLETTIRLSDITAGVSLAAFLFGVLGVQIIGQEYRFNTIRPTFTAVPQRPKVLVAKLLVITAVTAAVAAVMTGVCVLIGQSFADPFAMEGADRRLLWSIPLFAALWSTAGLGLGAIVRQPIAGILIMLGEAFVAENLIRSIVDGSAEWLPFLNGIQMTSGGELDAELRPLLEGGIYFAIVCFALFAIGVVLADRRDA